jgi:hypothetical protein
MRRARPLAALGGSAAAALSFAVAVSAPSAGAASAPAIAVAPKCVVNAKPASGSPMAVAGSGFTPGDSIELSAGDTSGNATANSAGEFSVLIPAPTLATFGAGAKKFTITAQDDTTGTGSASSTFWVANLAFTTNPSVANPSKVVHFSFSGFKPGKVVYAHYLRGKKVVATQKFGRATGICGLLKDKARLFPLHNPPSGTYKVQVDDSRSYRAMSLPRVDSSLQIERF